MTAAFAVLIAKLLDPAIIIVVLMLEVMFPRETTNIFLRVLLAVIVASFLSEILLFGSQSNRVFGQGIPFAILASLFWAASAEAVYAHHFSKSEDDPGQNGIDQNTIATPTLPKPAIQSFQETILAAREERARYLMNINRQKEQLSNASTMIETKWLDWFPQITEGVALVNQTLTNLQLPTFYNNTTQPVWNKAHVGSSGEICKDQDYFGIEWLLKLEPLQREIILRTGITSSCVRIARLPSGQSDLELLMETPFAYANKDWLANSIAELIQDDILQSEETE